MRPALQSEIIEQEYESFDGLPRERRYYDWNRRRWVTHRVIDLGRREARRGRPGAFVPGHTTSLPIRRG